MAACLNWFNSTLAGQHLNSIELSLVSQCLPYLAQIALKAAAIDGEKDVESTITNGKHQLSLALAPKKVAKFAFLEALIQPSFAESKRSDFAENLQYAHYVYLLREITPMHKTVAAAWFGEAAMHFVQKPHSLH